MKSSFCDAGASCVEVGLDGGGNVLVWDSKNPGVPPLVWEPREWHWLLEGIRRGESHEAVRSFGAGVFFGRVLVDDEHLRFSRTEWEAFKAGVRAGEFDPDRLSSSASAPGGSDAERPGSDPVKPPHASEVRHGHDPSSDLVSRDLPDGAQTAATGAGDPNPVPAPVAAPLTWPDAIAIADEELRRIEASRSALADREAAASEDVPAGRLSDHPCDPTTPPPLGADQPGPELSDEYARGYAAAVARLRDDDRYRNWWSAGGAWQHQPTGRYWDASSRRHLADYLETVGPDGFDVTASAPAPAIDDAEADELLRRGAAPLVDHNPDGADR